MLATTYTPKLPRWVHQNKAHDAMNGHDAFALFMEMRTGKTKVILDEFGEDVTTGEIQNLLVIAPAGVYRVWEVDAEKHLSDAMYKQVKIARWESKATPSTKRNLAAFVREKGPKILLVNVEACSTVDELKVICTLMLTAGPTTMVIDESTTIKNRIAARTKFCLRASRLAKKRRILSGLPSPQSPLDLFSQFDFLGPGILGYTSFTKFKERYAVVQQKPFGPGGRMIDVVTGYQNLQELQDRIRPYAFRVRLKDCYDLPEKMYLRRDVEMTPEQATLYNEMREYAVAQLAMTERVTATIVLVQLLRLHQILMGHTKSDDGKEVEIPENRTTELLEILDNTSGKAIIWCAYDADVRRLTKAIEAIYLHGSVARFWGGNEKTREAEEKQFKTDPKCRFMIATPAAGGRGRTWDVADTVIYYSNTFNLEHRMQSEERAQLVGKKGSVAYFDLMCPGTVEEKIVNALRSKMHLSDAITGDEWREWIV
jgi:Mesyanzhinovviridae DNA helicase